ncbi:MAG: YhcH/YjgK/YiaL family protein [Pirellulaceae bacterium]
MILDHLCQHACYESLHPSFAAAFRFLQKTDWSCLKDGRQEIDGDRLFALVATDHGRGRDDSPLEYHRRYIDIQYVVEGVDEMGWKPMAMCQKQKLPFDSERDIGFFCDAPDLWLPVPEGKFTIFFPTDCHAPLAASCETKVRKAVVKIAVDS